MTDAQEPTIADDIMTIHRLIDLACFTTNETLTTARMRAEEALERIETALRECE